MYDIVSAMYKKLVGDVMDRNYDVIIFFQNTVVLRRKRIAKFADIVKIAIISIKTTLEDSIKVKRIRNYVSKCDFYLYFPIEQKILITRGK